MTILIKCIVVNDFLSFNINSIKKSGLFLKKI